MEPTSMTMVHLKSCDEHTYHHPITVNQILLARTKTNISETNFQEGGTALEMLQFREEVE